MPFSLSLLLQSNPPRVRTRYNATLHRLHRNPFLYTITKHLYTLVAGMGNLTAVSNQLPSSNDLTNGEEADNLGAEDAGEDQVLSGERTEVLHSAAEEGGGGGGGDGLEGGLEGGDAALGGLVWVGRGVREGAYGGVMFWPRKTILESSMATLE